MWRDTFSTAVSSLRGNWLRSALTSLGVIIGIAAVVTFRNVAWKRRESDAGMESAL